MALELVKKSINGVTYEISQFPLERSQKTFHKLSRLMSPSIGGMIGALADLFSKEEKPGIDTAIEDMNWDALSKSVVALFSSLNEDEAPKLTRELCDGGHILADGKKLDYDTHFQTMGLAQLYKVSFAVVEVNYKDFLFDIRDGFAAALGSLPDMMPGE